MWCFFAKNRSRIIGKSSFAYQLDFYRSPWLLGPQCSDLNWDWISDDILVSSDLVWHCVPSIARIIEGSRWHSWNDKYPLRLGTRIVRSLELNFNWNHDLTIDFVVAIRVWHSVPSIGEIIEESRWYSRSDRSGVCVSPLWCNSYTCKLKWL